MASKLVAIDDASGGFTAVATPGGGAGSEVGRKAAFRLLDDDGLLRHDLHMPSNHVAITDRSGPGRRLQVRLVNRGAVTGQPLLAASRSWCASSRAELPAGGRLPDPDIAFRTALA